MIALRHLHNALADKVERLSPTVLPLLARFTFAATLLGYFWASGLTKLGSGIFGIFNPSLGAYAQIFPKAMEAAGYDVSKLTAFHTLVVSAGTLAEFVLPLLLVIGLFTRLAAVGMIGFVIVQTLTDLFGHGGISHPETLGAWFDRLPDSLILDQRLFWMVVLITLGIKGAGPLSIDRLLNLR
ncbi:DoxX family protein [Aliiroseovarius crassostreae]|uniref:DoxX family protein n=1 Tax=Aliiroseovarius crassostreae TaxID=154981 RepID=UPI003C7CEBE9